MAFSSERWFDELALWNFAVRFRVKEAAQIILLIPTIFEIFEWGLLDRQAGTWGLLPVGNRLKSVSGENIVSFILHLVTLWNAETGENCIMQSFVVCASRRTLRVTSSRRIRWAGTVAGMGGKGNAYRILLGTSWRRWTLGRRTRWWVVEGMDWI